MHSSFGGRLKFLINVVTVFLNVTDVGLNEILEVVPKPDVENAIIIDWKTSKEAGFSLVIDDRFPKFSIFLTALPFPLCIGPRVSQF